MAVPVNPMARFAVPAGNPLTEVIAMRDRQKAQQNIKNARRVPIGLSAKRLNDFIAQALREKMAESGPDRPLPRGTGIGGGGMMLGSMSGVPETEDQVRIRDRREKMRAELMARIREDRGARPDEYAMAERDYAKNASKRGAFLKKAYDVVGTPEGYTDFDLDLMRTQGLVNPLLDEYNPVTRERVAREFQRTHKWARKKENLADLDIAVKYLMSRPNFEQSFYYNP